MIFALAVAWALAVTVDVAADRWHSRLDPRQQAVSFSILPLGRQILKLSLYLAALLSVFTAWGYNTTTILAGLGVGGLAVALAAQKTIENLFGGVSVIGDRPVLVGDVCRFGDRTGTVMHIGLRSTRIRTPERTVISVPNAQFFVHAAREYFEPGQDLVPSNFQSPAGHDLRANVQRAYVACRDSGRQGQSRDRPDTGAVHWRGPLLARR